MASSTEPPEVGTEYMFKHLLVRNLIPLTGEYVLANTLFSLWAMTVPGRENSMGTGCFLQNLLLL